MNVASPLQTEGTFTSAPPHASERAGGTLGLGIEERLRERFRQKSRPNLVFVGNDHEILPDGRIKVTGRVENTGGSAATQARVRIRILLENGDLAAQGESPLIPPTIPPGGSASFELPIDYTGPVGRIKAELVWIE